MADTEIRALQHENESLRRNLELLNELQRRHAVLSERITLINRVSHDLNTLDLDKIGKIAVERIATLVGARLCSLYLHEYARGELVLMAHNHPGEISERIDLTEAKNTVMGRAVREKQYLHVVEFAEFEARRGETLDRPFAAKYATSSCISMPLKTGNYLVGVLNVADKVDGTPFDEMDDLPVVEQLGQVAAMAIRNCRLFEEVQQQAKTDPLTHLLNYRAFYNLVRSEMGRAVRYVRPLSLLMVDVDNFKKANDTMGHTWGDRILVAIAEKARAGIRKEDHAARYGGDEISLLLPETPLEGAKTVAQRVLDGARTLRFADGKSEFHVTLSIGIAELQPQMTVTEFIDAADQSLLKAKGAGKNRIEPA